MKRFCAFLLILISINSCAWNSPEAAVLELLKFDMSGGRLTSTNWKKYTTEYLADLPEGYDEPGWDAVTIVNSFRVSGVRCTEAHCKVEVEFELFPTSGLKPGPFNRHPAGGIEKIVYVALKRGASWKVRAAQDPSELVGPHISIGTYKSQ